jgi:hypothetical protein
MPCFIGLHLIRQHGSGRLVIVNMFAFLVNVH